MGKQRRLAEINAQREQGAYDGPDARPARVVAIFRRHYELAAESMTPEHAAASAHDAVQRHLASERDAAARVSTPAANRLRADEVDAAVGRPGGGP
jgi:hypothetical protein